LKEDAAQTLSNLSQATFPAQHQLPVQQHAYPGPNALGQHPAISDPGPSSHPRGPPNLGQLSAVAAAGMGTMQNLPQMTATRQEMEEGASGDDDGGEMSGTGVNPTGASATSPSGGRTRGGRSATMGSDEWSRQRKDNHVSVVYNVASGKF
jgi:hypothetical protein